MKQLKQLNQNGLFTLLIVLSVPYLALSLNQHGFMALLPFIREEFILSRTQVGLYATFYFLSSALLAVSTGSIVDRLGPRKGILLGIGFMGSVFFLYGFAPSYEILLGLAFLAGLGWSIITPSVNKAVLMNAPADKRAVSMGIMQSGVGIGGLMGASLLPVISVALGWRPAIQMAAGFSIIVWFLVLTFYREKKAGIAQVKPVAKKGNPGFVQSLIDLTRNKALLNICILGLMFGVACGAVISHFVVYLSEDLSVSRAVAGLGLGSFQIGGIVGRPIWGVISDRFFKGKRGKALMVLGIAIGIKFIISGLLSFAPPISTYFVVIFAFILGFSAFGWPGVHFVSIAENAGEDQVGMATGLSLLFLRAGLLAGPPIFGYLADIQESYILSWISFGAIITLLYVTGLLKSSKETAKP